MPWKYFYFTFIFICFLLFTLMHFSDGFQENMNNICVDIDECSNNTLNDCNLSLNRSICTNTFGGFNCSCLGGYIGNGSVSKSDE